jgi:Acetyltransferase (GNAT) domain
MTAGSVAAGTPAAAASAQRDLRWQGRMVRVTSPAPSEVWAEAARSDPAAMPFHTPAWRDCVVSGAGWRDASRLYELPGGRQLILMLASRRGAGGMLPVAASWPSGWGAGGILAAGGLRPEEAALVGADLRRGQELSVAVRPGFAAAPAWQGAVPASFTIPRAVHVAQFAGSFTDFTASLGRRQRQQLRSAERHADAAGVVITSGNSPELVQALYDVYLRWIGWRARERKMPAAVAQWRGRRAEPLAKFATVAATLAGDCRIQVAWWEGRPVGAEISLFASGSAVGWRCFTDRTVPARFRLTELLVAGSLRYACETGCRYLEMGESVGRSELAGNKARMGGEQHAFAEYCFERLPLARARAAAGGQRKRAEDWIMGRSAAAREEGR